MSTSEQHELQQRSRPLWREPVVVGLFILGSGFLIFSLRILLRFFLAGVPAAAEDELTSIIGGVFCLLFFGSGGAGVLALVAWLVREERRERRARKQWPKQPWRWREDWSKGFVTHTKWHGMAVVAVFAAFWNGMIGFVTLLALLSERADRPLVLWTVLIMFWLVGCGLAGWAGKLAWAARRWGTSRLKLAAVPAALGDRLVAVVDVPRIIAAGAAIRLTLTCSETRELNPKILGKEIKGGERRTYEQTHWQAMRQVRKRQADPVLQTTRIPVAFDLPRDGRSAHYPVSWTLEVEANDGCPAYHAEFEVPVFRIRSRKSGLSEETEQLDDWLVEEDFMTLLKESGGEIYRDDPERLEIRFASTRRLENPWILGAFCVAWLIGTSGLLLDPQWPFWLRYGFPLVGLLVAGTLVEARFSWTDIRVTPEHLLRVRRYFGMQRTLSIPCKDIEKIESLQQQSVFDPAAECLCLQTTVGKRCLLLKGLPKRSHGDAIARRLSQSVQEMRLFRSGRAWSETRQPETGSRG